MRGKSITVFSLYLVTILVIVFGIGGSLFITFGMKHFFDTSVAGFVPVLMSIGSIVLALILMAFAKLIELSQKQYEVLNDICDMFEELPVDEEPEPEEELPKF